MERNHFSHLSFVSKYILHCVIFFHLTLCLSHDTMSLLKAEAVSHTSLWLPAPDRPAGHCWWGRWIQVFISESQMIQGTKVITQQFWLLNLELYTSSEHGHAHIPDIVFNYPSFYMLVPSLCLVMLLNVMSAFPKFL